MTTFGIDTDNSNENFDIEALLKRAIEIVDSAKSMPLSASVIVPRDDMLAILEACIENLPLEIRQANWMLRERNEFLAKMEREGDEILRAARERAERMVQRSELVREAQRTAERLVTDAQDKSRKLSHEADEYCDQQLASFEAILEKTYRTVQGGRQKLRGNSVVNLSSAERSEKSERSAASHDPLVSPNGAHASTSKKANDPIYDQERR